eukprot:6204745-Amphidinium_carterae.2
MDEIITGPTNSIVSDFEALVRGAPMLPFTCSDARWNHLCCTMTQLDHLLSAQLANQHDRHLPLYLPHASRCMRAYAPCMGRSEAQAVAPSRSDSEAIVREFSASPQATACMAIPVCIRVRISKSSSQVPKPQATCEPWARLVRTAHLHSSMLWMSMVSLPLHSLSSLELEIIGLLINHC